MQLNKEDMYNRIQQLDRDASLLFEDEARYFVVIVGGGALIMMGYSSRSTQDIDVINATKVLIELLEKYDMNTRVTAYQNSFPFNFEDRLSLLWRGKKIDFYSASLEDIVIAKLCANRPSDDDDLEAAAEYVNWETLERLALSDDELILNIMSDFQYGFFLEKYNEYVRRFRP